MSTKMHPPPSTRTHRPRAVVQDAYRKRQAVAYKLTLALSGTSPKRAALALGVAPSTISRWRSGEMATAVERAVEHLRALVETGAGFPVPIFVDAVAGCLDLAASRWPDDELAERVDRLHRDVAESYGKVLLWQLGDDQGAECEALLEWLSRGVELYALTCELQLRTGGRERAA